MRTVTLREFVRTLKIKERRKRYSENEVTCRIHELKQAISSPTIDEINLFYDLMTTSERSRLE